MAPAAGAASIHHHRSSEQPVIARLFSFDYLKPINEAPNGIVDFIQNARAAIGFVTVLVFISVYGEGGRQGDDAIAEHLAHAVWNVPNVGQMPLVLASVVIGGLGLVLTGRYVDWRPFVTAAALFPRFVLLLALTLGPFAYAGYLNQHDDPDASAVSMLGVLFLFVFAIPMALTFFRGGWLALKHTFRARDAHPALPAIANILAFAFAIITFYVGGAEGNLDTAPSSVQMMAAVTGPGLGILLSLIELYYVRQDVGTLTRYR